MSARVAVVDDQPRVGEVLAMVLAGAGYRASAFTSGQRLLEVLRERPDAFDLVVTDLRMPELDGVGLLAALRALRADLPVIIVTAHGSVGSAVEAMQGGAADYLQKPIDNDALRATAARCLDHARLRRENDYLRGQLDQRAGTLDVVAESPAMEAALDLALRAARSRATVLITGASGTGKEVVARAIHLHSERRGGPFEAVNCKALAAGVLESELFGHEKGAFTGAGRARAGLFERAHGGTVFLDEIGEVDGDFQGKLLRVLQQGEVQRVGGDGPLRVDVRVVAATHRDLRADVQSGRFREDLYFRLAVVPVHLPPLRERPADILPLAHRFFARACQELGRPLRGWSPELEAWLLAHAWPGNVRELENAIERGVVLARGERVELADVVLPESHGDTASAAAARAALVDEPLQASLDRMAGERIAAALAHAHGARGEAARALGIDRTTLFRWMRRLGMGVSGEP